MTAVDKNGVALSVGDFIVYTGTDRLREIIAIHPTKDNVAWTDGNEDVTAHSVYDTRLWEYRAPKWEVGRSYRQAGHNEPLHVVHRFDNGQAIGYKERYQVRTVYILDANSRQYWTELERSN